MIMIHGSLITIVFMTIYFFAFFGHPYKHDVHGRLKKCYLIKCYSIEIMTRTFETIGALVNRFMLFLFC